MSDFLAHFNFDFLLVFVYHAHCEAEANDDEVTCARLLQAALPIHLGFHPDSRCALHASGKALGFAHRRTASSASRLKS